jgi:hypothetical protein
MESKALWTDILASWGAALRSRTAGSQDESPRRAIHKQRPYHSRIMLLEQGSTGKIAYAAVQFVLVWRRGD